MTQESLRIASYNIRKARGLDQKRRPERTLQVINQLDADIVVLQEADKRLGVRKPAVSKEMIEAETDYRVLDVAQNGISLGWHGNAVLVRGSLSVLGIHHIDLPGVEPRGAVQVDLGIGAGLSLVGAHLGLLRRDRRAQLDVLREHTSDAEHVVIAGDFNEWSEDKGLEPLEGRFVTHAPGRSFHARRPIAALDRFALSYGLSMQDAGVNEGALAKRASDHLPVWTDIRIPAAAITC
jgi:endonuclease/exonuclease/phosphatase family metal-dependent hydrolase